MKRKLLRDSQSIELKELRNREQARDLEEQRKYLSSKAKEYEQYPLRILASKEGMQQFIQSVKSDDFSEYESQVLLNPNKAIELNNKSDLHPLLKRDKKDEFEFK